VPDVTWLFVVLAAVAVFAIAAVTVGREAFRLGHQPPPTIFDLDEAVAHVADDLPFDAQARLSYDEVRELIVPEVVLADDEAVAVVLGRAEEAGLEVTDEDVFQVIASLHGYLAEIGAVGPPASGSGSTGPAEPDSAGSDSASG
jgi:hypothetical protein